jgi:hypothetical protein
MRIFRDEVLVFYTMAEKGLPSFRDSEFPRFRVSEIPSLRDSEILSFRYSTFLSEICWSFVNFPSIKDSGVRHVLRRSII